MFKQNQYFMKKRYYHIFLFALLVAFNVDVFATSSVGRVFDEWNISASVSPVNLDDRLVFIDFLPVVMTVGRNANCGLVLHCVHT